MWTTPITTQFLYNSFQFTFPEFSDVVAKNLRMFSKRSAGCFVKSNWHAPIDARWINTGQSLCVRSLDEFYQVVKASDILKEDLSRLGDDTDYVIAFREYVSHIHPGSEFRCYVKRNELIGITSRWWPEFFPHFLAERSQILTEIQRFYLDHIQNKFSLDSCKWTKQIQCVNCQEFMYSCFSPPF